MKETKDINTVTLPFAKMLDDIADTGTDVMQPDGFENGNRAAYKTVVQDLQEYLFDDGLYMLNRYFEARDVLQSLLDRAEELVSDRIKILTCSAAESYEVKQVQDDARLRQATHISNQLEDLLNFIHPENLIKP